MPFPPKRGQNPFCVSRKSHYIREEKQRHPKMRKALYFLLITLFILSPCAAERKRVGLVLGGGGAKGAAHIGVLKVLEEAGIPIDYIAGTSMGAIVGGLYAVGYSANEIDSLVNRQDWNLLLSDRVKRSNLSFPEKENSERYIISLPFGKSKEERTISGMIQGQNLLNLFSGLTIGYHDSLDFNQLPIPFACVAVDIVKGEEHVFRGGSLPLALRASMAIPAVFSPVKLDSMILVDGGLSNNYPADIAKAMGADIIIGVDLGTSDLKEHGKINSASDVVGQIVALYGNKKYEKNKQLTDLLVRPRLDPYNSASFSLTALDTLIQRGEQAARGQWDEIIALKERIGTDGTKPARRQSPTFATDTFHIRHIRFEGADPKDQPWLLKISGLKENSDLTVQQLQDAVSILVGTNAYQNIDYKLIGDKNRDLIFSMRDKTNSAINVGVRLDNEEIVAALLNVTYDYKARYHSKIALTGRIGKRAYGRLDYAIERSPLRNINFSYMFEYNNTDINYHGTKNMDATFRHHLLEIGYTDVNWLSFKLNLGARYEYFDFNTPLYTTDHLQTFDIRSKGYINYFITAHLETLDRNYFPSKGISLKADYTIYTDNFVTNDGHTLTSALGLNFKAVVPVTSHFSFIPAASGRVLIGNGHGFPYLNMAGGEQAGKYFPQQLPLAGINYVEVFNNSLIIAQLTCRQRISQNHYISLIANYALHHDNLFELLKGESVWGGSLGYAYNSIAGPLSASFGLSNRNRNFQVNLNLGFFF